MKNLLLISALALSGSVFSADEDRASRDNADNAKDSHESGEGRGLDFGCCDWKNRDRDNNQPDNSSEERGTIPMCGDSKD